MFSLLGGHKMYHPSIYVLVTDLDDMEEMEAAASQKCPLGTSSSAEAAALAALSSANQTSNTNSCSNNNITDTRKPLMENFSNNKQPVGAMTTSATPTINGTKSSLAHVMERLKIDRTKVQPYYDTKTRNFTCNTTNTHAPPQAACEMPERVWQECVTNGLHIEHSLSGTISSINNTINSSSSTHANSSSNTLSSSTTTATSSTLSLSGGISNNNNENATTTSNEEMDQTDNVDIKPNTTTLSQKQQQQQIWGFVDPTQKAACICTK